MKLDQLIEYNKINIFPQKLCRKWGRETSSRPPFIFKKSLKWGESQYISKALNLANHINKLHKTLDYWSRDVLNFNFPVKGLGLVYLTHICMVFQEKCFSCYILLTNQISLSDCLFFSRSWAICVLQLFVNQTVTS